MTCRTLYDDAGKAIGIGCSRGQRPSKALCDCCRKQRHTKLCDFPLTGSKAGKTCDRKLCDACAVEQPAPRRRDRFDTVDYCPAHAKEAP